jgi:membrane protein required for colicin V production
MSWLDAVLVIILAVSVATSLHKGFSREVIGLLSVVAATILGCWFYGYAGGVLAHYIKSRTAANCIGFFLVFCAVVLLGSFVSFILGKFLKVTGLSFFDHLLGAVFGLVRGALIAVAMVMALMAFSPGNHAPQAVVHSRLAPYATEAAGFVAAMAPHELKEGFRKTYTQVKQAWGQVERGIQHLPGDKKPNERRI